MRQLIVLAAIAVLATAGFADGKKGKKHGWSKNHGGDYSKAERKLWEEQRKIEERYYKDQAKWAEKYHRELNGTWQFDLPAGYYPPINPPLRYPTFPSSGTIYDGYGQPIYNPPLQYPMPAHGGYVNPYGQPILPPPMYGPTYPTPGYDVPQYQPAPPVYLPMPRRHDDDDD